MQIRCPQCRLILDVREDSAGLIVRCGSCGQQLRVPNAAAPAAPLAVPVPAARPVEPARPAPEVFANLDDEPLWKREQANRRKRQSRGWRVFALGAGVVVGVICGAAIGAGWGRGVNSLLMAFTGSVVGTIALAVLGAGFMGLMAVRLFLFRLIHIFLLIGVVCGAFVGSIFGANVGAEVGARPAAGRVVGAATPPPPRLTLAGLGAVGGGGLGALPGAALFLLARKRRDDDGRYED